MQAADHEYFIALANNLAQRSNCVRRLVGAVIVRHGQIVAEGWNGVLGGNSDCRVAGCPRCISGGDTGSGYETCICIHAEQRAIAEAARLGIGIDDSALYVNLRPCLQCLVIARAAGVRNILYSGEEWTYPEPVERVYRSLSDQFDSFSRIGEQDVHGGRPVRLTRED